MGLGYHFKGFVNSQYDGKHGGWQGRYDAGDLVKSYFVISKQRD